MAGIYKHGFPSEKDREEATSETLAAIRASGDHDLVLEEASIIETDDHKAASEYLVRIVTGQPEPEPGPEPGPDPLVIEREQLRARLAEIDAELG